MKVLLYNMTSEQQVYVDKWNHDHPEDELTTTKDKLDAETVELAKGFDGISVLQVFDIDEKEVYSKLASYGIKQIALRSVGYNIINWKYVHQYHLLVTNTPAYSPRAVAENTLTSAMYLLRKWGQILQNERVDFNFIRSEDLMSDEIYNQTVGIIGVGRIGSAVGEIFHALGAKVLGYDIVENPANEAFLDYADFDTVIREADILTLHTPFEPGMADMISAKQFKQMKDTAILINAARGPLVNTQDLISALKQKEIAGASLDVMTGEEAIVMKKFNQLDELPKDYQELAQMPNVVFTPHSAYYTKTAVKNMIEQSMIDMKRVLNGQQPVYPVEE
ncbi:MULTISPECIES: D-2-hydroxyacid dehydrogenase [unclassified Lactobacillus]|uniref:D-2-hydroxyacid dehydrogenase n=1 Tax=unclassified Lactobacillus TaxID=2620435 RepID=UPI000EFA752B|nr:MULTISPECIES: D-2-hydroxyacid dehydrogenase [unclassified Lactobacillus]RMC24910.1 D-2-hydroxyacid dehydrogenase [Lactobacillus sp. ESL0247]RMC29065.1 D-2-hydroxyacid dehydrogenase [Lactobacillus sp. ESL0246]RMC32668.1 D-2-hydroxyacid dehydrogenase [Lactobacillus sp. ESL0245]